MKKEQIQAKYINLLEELSKDLIGIVRKFQENKIFLSILEAENIKEDSNRGKALEEKKTKK